mmetsp:Transcript_33844/g.61110  ORF Transcript_33844/g.61110 Transcript_33844/m.61110 type:complete len:203 (-) Transcript_33844:541-1149(-)
MTKSTRSDKQKRTSIVHKGVELHSGECVIVNPDEDAPPYLAKIIGFLIGKTLLDIEVEVYWFYRPEELKHGRKAFHGYKEVLSSDHYDVIHVNTIVGRCNILTLEEFTKLNAVKEEDYFTRFSYEAVSAKYFPDKVPVYCKCCMPFNPDREMRYCAICLDWYHVECAQQANPNPRPITSAPAEDSGLTPLTCPICNGSGINP